MLFLGLDKTVAATTALEAVRAKVDDYFARCRVAAFDPRALPLLNRKEDDYVAALADDLSASAEELAAFPLALVAAGRPLPLGEGDQSGARRRDRDVSPRRGRAGAGRSRDPDRGRMAPPRREAGALRRLARGPARRARRRAGHRARARHPRIAGASSGWRS